MESNKHSMVPEITLCAGGLLGSTPRFSIKIYPPHQCSHSHLFSSESNSREESWIGIWPSQDIFIRNQIHTLVFLKSHFPINMKTVRNWNLSSTFTFQLIWIRVWCETVRNWHLSSDHWVRLPMMLMITNQFRKGNHVETFRWGRWQTKRYTTYDGELFITVFND